MFVYNRRALCSLRNQSVLLAAYRIVGRQEQQSSLSRELKKGGSDG
jgi:hypothetical protein